MNIIVYAVLSLVGVALHCAIFVFGTIGFVVAITGLMDLNEVGAFTQGNVFAIFGGGALLVLMFLAQRFLFSCGVR